MYVNNSKYRMSLQHYLVHLKDLKHAEIQQLALDDKIS